MYSFDVSPISSHTLAMPFNIIGGALEIIDGGTLAMAGVAAGTAYATKLYASGRKNIWERDWTGKLIIIAVSERSVELGSCGSDTVIRPHRRPQHWRSLTTSCGFHLHRRCSTSRRSRPPCRGSCSRSFTLCG
jgi:hypothetical protein